MSADYPDPPAFATGDAQNLPGLVGKLTQLREAIMRLTGSIGPNKGTTAWEAFIAAGGFTIGPGTTGTVTGGGTTGGGSTDLTPPPTPSLFAASAGLSNLIVTCGNPTYTAGGGHQFSRVYGATYTGSGPLPTFASAVVIDTFEGTIDAIAENLGTEWHLWLTWVTNANVESTTPAGGTNGITVTTGKIGNADLGPLIVTADKLSQGAYPGLNIIPNGGSEDGTVCWQVVDVTAGGGTLSVDTSVKSSGSSSFKVAKVSTSDGVGMGSNAVPVIPGETYSVKLRAQGSTSTTIGFYVIMNEAATRPSIGYVTAAAAASRTQLFTNGPINNAWELFDLTYTVPAGVYWTTLEIVTAPSGPLTLWFDDVQMGRQITASSIAAGSIAVGTAAIQNGAIVNAMIGSLQVDDAKIASAGVAKLTAGSLQVGSYIQSSTFVSGSSGWHIDANGNAEFAAGVIRGTLVASQIGAGQVTASKINVSSLDAMSANIGTLRTTGSGQRTEIKDNKIGVFDSSNVLRVRIGDLSGTF